MIMNPEIRNSYTKNDELVTDDISYQCRTDKMAFTHSSDPVKRLQLFTTTIHLSEQE